MLAGGIFADKENGTFYTDRSAFDKTKTTEFDFIHLPFDGEAINAPSFSLSLGDEFFPVFLAIRKNNLRVVPFR